MTSSNGNPPHTGIKSNTIVSLREMAGLLSKIGNELNELNGSSEEEFIAIGARLHDFQRRACEITTMATEIVNLVDGDEIKKGTESLKLMIERFRFYLESAEQKAELSDTALHGILVSLDNVDGPLAGFRKMNKTLRMLGISTRIESTRLANGAEGFDTLAGDVQQLNVQIDEKASSVHERKAVLNNRIRQTLERVRSIESGQRTDAGTILDKTGLSLTGLNDINARCSGVAVSITSAAMEVAGNMGIVVTSMQVHDITRQQIEHACEALAELRDMLEAEAEKGLADEWGEMAGRAGDVCELQVAQLEHSLNELVGAINNIIENLNGIGAQEASISSEIKEMTGVADKAGASFFNEMESALTGVASVLERSAVASGNLAAELDSLTGTIGEISLFVDCIKTIGDEIELIALNARIKAARTGEQGAALGVLAEAIQRLSLDSRSQSGEISSMLGGITDVSAELRRGIGSEASALEGEVQGLVRDLGELLRVLRQVNSSLLALLGKLDGDVETLNADIAAVTTGITVHQRSSSVLGKVIGELAGIASAMRTIAPKDAAMGSPAGIGGLAGRYTMHSERKIHESMARSRHDTAAVDVPLPAQAEPNGEFGDNVELF